MATRRTPGEPGSPIVPDLSWTAPDRRTPASPTSPLIPDGATPGQTRKTPGSPGSPTIAEQWFNWYVDTQDGSDSDNGKTNYTPVKNWHALEDKPIKKGHTIGVKRRSTVPTATMYADDLTIGAYGPTGDPDPVIQSIVENGFSEPTIQPGVVVASSGIDSFLYWSDGLPVISDRTDGGHKYWADGLPYEIA